jgi:hypothetical protein
MKYIDPTQRGFHKVNFAFLAAIPFLTAAATVGTVATAGVAIASAAGAFNAKASTINPNPTPTTAQTVDPSLPSNVNNLGRAALIMTSPQGVQGSDPKNRYALLGNSSTLGNNS